MSKDTNKATGDRPSDDAVAIRAFRFEFRHALAFSAVSMLFVLGAGAVLSLARFGGELSGHSHNAVLSAIPSAVERSAYRPIPEQRPDEETDTASNSSPPTKGGEEERLVAEQDLSREKQRAHAERELTQVFASVDRSNVEKMHKFLEAYRDDPLAQELGYIDAVQRSVSDRRRLGPHAVAACDDCWCLREAPASVKANTVTQ